MLRVLALLLCLASLWAVPSLAQIYRWTDADGKVHFTDNPSTIPADRLESSREPFYERSGAPAPPPRAPRPSAVAPLTSAGSKTRAAPDQTIDGLRQRERALEQEIDTVLQERQRSLDRITAVRQVRTNPAFGRKRRRVATWGQELAAVERQLDTLREALQQVRTRMQAMTDRQPPAPSGQPPSRIVGFDQRGHDRVYWQRRLKALRVRRQEARAQRQAILAQLAPESQEDRRAFGRRGQQVLELAQALERLEQERRDVETALRALRHEATRAGAPAAWLE